MHIANDLNSSNSVKIEGSRNNSENNNNNNNNVVNSSKSSSKKDESPYLTPENFIERTVDGVLAEHPGELIKTGSPHVVSEYYFYLKCGRFPFIKL